MRLWSDAIFSGLRISVGAELISSVSSELLWVGAGAPSIGAGRDISAPMEDLSAVLDTGLGSASSAVGVVDCAPTFACNGCPQLLQNFASSRFGVLHIGQYIPALLLSMTIV